MAAAAPVAFDPNTLNEIRDLLRDVVKNQSAQPFNAGTAAAVAIAAAFSFILALALNAFFQMLFAKIPVGSGLLGAGIYAIIALVVCILALFLIYSFLEPFLHKKFQRA